MSVTQDLALAYAVAHAPLDKKPLPIPDADDVKLILSDVDGTLFTDKHELHPRTRDAIRHIREQYPNVPFIPVTGKQRVSCETLIDDLNLNEFPAACCHGAIIHSPSGKIIRQAVISPEIVLGVLGLMASRNKTVMAYEADTVNMISLETDGTKDWEAVSRGFDPSIVDSRRNDFIHRVARGEAKISKIFLPMDEDQVPEYLTLLSSTLPRGYKMTRALPYIIELVPENVDKAVALDFFCEHYGVAPENVLTMGDGENDVGMLSKAGHSLSMGNAMHQPKVVAKYSTSTNNEGGVGVFLDKIFRPQDTALNTPAETPLGTPIDEAVQQMGLDGKSFKESTMKDVAKQSLRRSVSAV